ncbi:MAG: enoyl-CoA hydratase-related protein, partial [Chloroflexota bacterium]
HDQLMEVVAATAAKLASGPTMAFGLTKRAMRQAMEQSFSDSLTTEIHLQNYAGRSYDFAEGVSAFFQKREPKYKGK